MNTITKEIKVFADFLNNSWSIVHEVLMNRDYTTDESSVNDWLQANWELLVERKVLKINEYLEVYGDEADFNGDSSRITDPDASPNYKVRVKPKIGNEVFDLLNKERVESYRLSFDKLVTFREGFYFLEPGFEFVLCIDDESDIERVVAIAEVDFVLERV